MKYLWKILISFISLALIIFIITFPFPVTKGSGRYYYKVKITDLDGHTISDAKYLKDYDFKALRDLYTNIITGGPKLLDVTNILRDVNEISYNSFEVKGTVHTSHSIFGIINSHIRDKGAVLYINIDSSNSYFGFIEYPVYREKQEINISLKDMYKVPN